MSEIAQAPMTPEQPPVQPPVEQPEADESDPAFTAAVEYVMTVLYDNKAAVDVAKSLKGQKDPAEALANTAYEVMTIVEEKTEGKVPDELFALLASRVLEEVAIIGEAAGIDTSGANLAQAMKTMILRYMGEQGADTTQLQAAMDQVNPEDFNKIGGE